MVDEEIIPPFSTESVPVAVTSILPALPVPPVSAWSMMPVLFLPCPSITIVSALTFTIPASLDEKVDEEIRPPFSTESAPVAVTSILPALPAPVAATSIMPVTTLLPCPSIIIVPALTFIVPASPDEKVGNKITPPFSTESVPVAVTSISPALPVLPLLAWSIMPVTTLLPCRSIRIVPALIFTIPASPDE